MIFIAFKEGQGLGNQLWNYIACRCLAKKLKLDFCTVGEKNFKGKHFLKLDYGIFLSNSNSNVFNERFYFDDELNYISHFYDERILDVKKNTLLNGYFQDQKYFFNYEDSISNFLNINNFEKNITEIDDDTCVINLRGGEYKRYKDLILPKKYWHDSINFMKDYKKIIKFIVVTDDYRYARTMFPNLEIISADVEKCYRAIMKAKYLILSNSSFSFFPIKTGRLKEFIIAPKYWARFGNKYNRWASPANLYNNWQWLDEKGKLFTSEECKEENNSLKNYYIENYNLVSNFNKFNQSGFRKFFPKSLRFLVKKILSFFFPKNF
jgi:hypothetical protein